MAVPPSGVPAQGAAPADAAVAALTADSITASTATIGTLTTTLGGELGGTPATATVDALHGGSTHAATQTAAEATASAALSSHAAGADPHSVYPLISEALQSTGGGKEVVKTVSASGAALQIALADGNVHDITLTANCTLTIVGATNGVACWLTVILRQDVTGSRTATWPVSLAWPGGSPPVLKTASGAFDIITMFTLDGGTVWHGAPVPLTAGDHASVNHAGLPGVGGATFVGCVAQRTTNQTGIVTVTPTAILMNGTDVVDTNGFHDPAVNSSRITVPSGLAGWYRPTAFVPWDTDATGYRQVFFRKNGAGYLDVLQFAALTGGINTHQTIVGRPVSLAVGDYIEVFVEHNSGANRTVVGGTLPAVLSVEYLGT